MSVKPNVEDARPNHGNEFRRRGVTAAVNEPPTQREFVREFLANYRYLFEESKLPGLRYVLGFHRPLRRTAWFLLYAVLFLLTLHDIYALLREYREYRDTLDQYVEAKQRVRFPAVTVCNTNPWRLRQLCSEPSFSSSRRGREWTSKLCGGNGHTIRGNVKELVRLSDWISAEQRRNFTRSRRMGHQLKDMIRGCYYGHQDCLKEKLIELRMIPRHGNCYCLGCNASLFQWTPNPMFYPEQGLRMTLNLEADEYLPLVADAGFYVMVHQPGMQEESVTNSLFVPPGHTTYIGVSMSVLHRLKAPYRNPCQDTWPPQFEKYACLEYCHQVHVFEACGCRSHNHIRIFVAEVANSPLCCDILKESCEREIEERVANGNITCHCLSACNTEYYQTTNSALSWTKNTASPHRKETGQQKMGRVKIVVFMQSTKVLHQKQQPKITAEDAFRKVGGLLGVYLGYTVLHVFHVLDVIVVGLSLAAKTIRSRRRIRR